MSATMTARQRARAELTAEIKAAARDQLAAHGAAGLSLRAVARELGMVSSAIYRYFPSRDDLLTALIIDAYDALGAAAEASAAEAASAGDDLTTRWMTLGRTIRGWAVENPHEYALLYGSPVPGYRAPQDTVPPATRVTAVLAAIASDAATSGRLTPRATSAAGSGAASIAGPAGPAGPAGAAVGPRLPTSLAADTRRIADLLMHGLDEAAVARCLIAWTAIFGTISFELFGHLNNVVTDYSDLFDHALRELAGFLGLPPSPDAAT